MLAPISGDVHSAFELLEVGPKSFTGLIDMSLYLTECFIHSTFSLSVSIVRSGIG